MKSLVKLIFMAIACIINSFAILYAIHLHFNIKVSMYKVVQAVLLVAISICLMIAIIKVKCINFSRTINILEGISLCIFLACAFSVMVKLTIIGAQRGDGLYHNMSLPALMPLVSSLLLQISKELN